MKLSSQHIPKLKTLICVREKQPMMIINDVWSLGCFNLWKVILFDISRGSCAPAAPHWQGKVTGCPFAGWAVLSTEPSPLCHTTLFALEVSMQVKLRCLQLCPLQKGDIISWVMGSMWGICCLIGVTLSVKKPSPWSLLFSVQNKLSLSLKHHLISEHQSP